VENSPENKEMSEMESRQKSSTSSTSLDEENEVKNGKSLLF